MRFWQRGGEECRLKEHEGDVRERSTFQQKGVNGLSKASLILLLSRPIPCFSFGALLSHQQMDES